MNDNLKIRFTQQLAPKLAVYTILAAIVTGSIISLLVISNNFSRTTRDLQTNAASLVELTLDSASEAVFQLDSMLAGTIVSGLMQHEAFSKVSIYDDLGLLLASETRDIPHDSWFEKFVHFEPIEISYTLPTDDSNDAGGTIVAVLELEAGLDEFYSLALITALVQILQALGLALVIFLIVAAFITTPLSEISRKLIGITPGTDAKLDIGYPHGYDELGQLVNSANRYLKTAAQYQTQLQLSQRNLQNILDHLVEGVVSVDDKGRIRTFNRAAESLFEEQEASAVGRPLSDYMYAEGASCFEEFAQLTSAAGQSGFECKGKRKTGKEFPVEAVLARYDRDQDTQLIWTIRDISERVEAQKEQSELESQLRHSQKMQAVGTLAGGIAHDFNNILAGIKGYAELAVMEQSQGKNVTPHLQRVIEASDKASLLIARILTFSRKQEENRRAVDVKNLANECVSLIQQTVPAKIKIHTEFLSEAFFVVCDESMLHQVLMNLLTNAAGALKNDAGEIRLVVSHSSEPDSSAAVFSPKRESSVRDTSQEFVKISVEDTGPGIPEEYIHRIFEPYFTSKQHGEGTGFGLAVVHSIVESHGGFITVNNSEPGACFSVYLPACNNSPMEADAPPSSEQLEKAAGERILIAEDNELLVDMMSELLGSQGFEVETAENGKAALELYTQANGNFDLVITDLTMPEMGGDDLAKSILEINPKQQIILCTGYTDSMTEEDVMALGISALLKKPVPFKKLSLTIREALSANKNNT